MQDQRLEWLKPKMDDLFQKKALLESKGKDFSMGIQSGREYRNPRICEKLIEAYDIKQYGTNLPKDHFDPDSWKKKPEAYYDSRIYRKLVEEREHEKQSNRDHHSHHHSHRTHHHHQHRNHSSSTTSRRRLIQDS